MKKIKNIKSEKNQMIIIINQKNQRIKVRKKKRLDKFNRINTSKC